MSSKEENTTTTTTTEAPEVNETAAASLQPATEHHGEVKVDESARAETTPTEQTQDERLDEARREAMHNHQVEHAND